DAIHRGNVRAGYGSNRTGIAGPFGNSTTYSGGCADALGEPAPGDEAALRTNRLNLRACGYGRARSQRSARGRAPRTERAKQYRTGGSAYGDLQIPESGGVPAN